MWGVARWVVGGWVQKIGGRWDFEVGALTKMNYLVYGMPWYTMLLHLPVKPWQTMLFLMLCMVIVWYTLVSLFQNTIVFYHGFPFFKTTWYLTMVFIFENTGPWYTDGFFCCMSWYFTMVYLFQNTMVFYHVHGIQFYILIRVYCCHFGFAVILFH